MKDMAEQYVPVGHAKVEVHFRLVDDPEPMLVTFGVSNADDEDADTIAGFVSDALTDATGPFPDATAIMVGWSLDKVVARKALAGGAESVGEAFIGLAGTHSGETLPQNCALLFRKLTAAGGRHGRGRFYLPPCTVIEENVSKNGMLHPADISAQQPLWSNFLGLLAGHDVPMELLHYPYTGAPTPAPTPVTALQLQPQIATVRRRLRA